MGRMTGVWRLIAFLYAWTVAALIASILFTIGLLTAAVDILWTLVFGDPLLSKGGTVNHVLAETWMWTTDIHVFAYTGKGGGFEWLPSV